MSFFVDRFRPIYIDRVLRNSKKIDQILFLVRNHVISSSVTHFSQIFRAYDTRNPENKKKTDNGFENHFNQIPKHSLLERFDFNSKY